MAYTLTGEKCGTVRLDPQTTGVVVTESIQRSSKVTSNPVERGADINDHVVTDPIKFTITGITIGDGQAAVLRRMWQQKDLLEYIGRNRISNCVVTSYKSDTNAKNKNGTSFTLQLQVVNIVSSEYVEIGAQLMSQQDANAKTSSGVGGTNQTRTTSADGLKTAVSEQISGSAYASYVGSYNSKPLSSGGPSSRIIQAYSAI